MKTILRWIAVLPGAVIAAVLSLFPLHWCLYSSLTGSGFIEPYPKTPEQLLSPLVFAIAFVWTGSQIAPKRNRATAICLAATYILLVAYFCALTLSGGKFLGQSLTFPNGGLRVGAGLVGVCIGVHLVFRQARRIKREANERGRQLIAKLEAELKAPNLPEDG